MRVISKLEAIVLIQQMQALLSDLVDMQADAVPQHVMLARCAHLFAVEQAISALRETYGVSA